ncbi:MAG: ArnT family glycosyltransferase, partial [Candidatus Heimdallarchaeota archaeon]
MPKRVEAIRMFIKRQQEMMSPLFGDLLHLLKVTLLSGSLYLVMLFFWFDTGRNFLTIDEALYLSWGVRWASGDYFIYPLYGDRILYFFIVSTFFRLFGVSLEVGRWVVHLFGVGLLVITYYIGKEVYGERVGILAMLILMFSGFFQLLSYYALTDIPSVFFFAATIFFFMKAFKYKNQRASFWGGLFCVLGVFSRLSYFAVFPIVGILWLKRLVRKELTLRETRKLITSALIVPLSAVVIVLLTYPDLFFDALRLGLVPFAKEATSGEFLRERMASLFGLRQNVTTLSFLLRTLLFPNLGEESLRGVLTYIMNEIVFPKPLWVSQIIDQYYEIERWILLTVFLLSLLYRRTRSFDLLAWIVTYGFIWLILAPSVGRIYIVEISDRYLYPLIPAIYIQFSCLIFLFLDKIRALQGGVSSFDYAIRAFKNKKLFMPLTAALLGLAIWRAANLSLILICGAISVLVFLKVGKERGEKGRVTLILASLATLFLIISNFSLQIQFLNAFFYSSPIQEVSYGIPGDLLAHEEIGQFEEGIWGKLSYAHLPPTPFTERIFLQDPLHAPGNFSGFYIWFSNDRARDRVEMYVRWITNDSSTPQTFSGHFQGTNVKFSIEKSDDCEKIEGDEISLERGDYLKFSGTVLGSDLDGFDLILDFIPNQKNYYIDWDLFQPRDPDRVFLGSMPLAKFAIDHFPIPPHQITFSTYSLQLKWRGLNRLADRTVFFNISYNELLVTEWSGVNWTDDYDMLIRTWTSDKKPLPIGNYLLWGTFSEILKEVELIVHGSKLAPNLKMNILVDWNQTDPNYVHIGMNRRNLPLEIEFDSTEDLHDWSISESSRSFFGRSPIENWSFYKFLILAWLICIILINAPDKFLPKNRIALKLKNNKLAAYFCWLVLGSLFLSFIPVITHEVPFWWDSIAHDYFETFNLSYHSGLLFWFVLEELILVGTLALGAWFLLSDLASLIMEKKSLTEIRKTGSRKTPLNIATAISLRNLLDLVKRNLAGWFVWINRTTLRIRTILVRFGNHLRLPFSPQKKRLAQIRSAGKA